MLAANADVIPHMRAGFIGAWGEWHSSKSGNSCGYNSGTTSCSTADINRAIVRDALFANVPSTTQIGFRYPVDLMKWYPSATQQKRAGANNDCFLSGASDTGTYQNSAQRTYVQALTANTAYGGETCQGETPWRTTCSSILTEGRQYHLAWLNVSYAPAMINAWKSGGCFSQVSGFMGYRLQLDGATHDTQVVRGGAMPITVNLRNVGWARMFSDRALVVQLRHKSTGAVITGKAGNLATLAPQATATTAVPVSVTIPGDAPTGDYDVFLSAPDVFATTAGDPRFSVRFANADNSGAGQTWDAAAARFKLGTTLRVN